MVGAVGGPLGLAVAVGDFEAIVMKVADRRLFASADRIDVEKNQKEQEKLDQEAHVIRLREQQQQAQNGI